MTTPTAKSGTKKTGIAVAKQPSAKKGASGVAVLRETATGEFRKGQSAMFASTSAVPNAAHLKLSAYRATRLLRHPLDLYQATEQERVSMIRSGVPASILEVLASNMGMTKEALYDTLRLPRSSISHKIRQSGNLSPEQSERVVGLGKLIGQVQALVNESGDPKCFDASRWIGDWLGQPIPALDGKTPAEFMDTMEGQGIVVRLLDQTQSGAYA